MKKQYKALMLDLDGTTMPNHRYGLPSQKVIEAIMKAHEKIFVCVATGRSLQDARPVLDALHITHPTILLGGSQIVAGASQRLVYQKPLQKEDVITILALLKPYRKHTLIDEEDRQVSPSLYNPDKVFNLLVLELTKEVADEIITQLSHLKAVIAHKITSWDEGKIGLNISHVLATKQHGIYEVAKLLEIETHEIIGVGDSYNDFPLLMACGLKIAMNNAVLELKEIADYIAPSVEEDGVATVIEKFVL
ncbi:MAG TPA: HAD-IIB family hydrolase [Candidatus Sulfotelmatobacter sp.]|jgi:HAD superfamily hydrolase (TIGR01484 family)|nr:HAD-IIB family hydrolase [Candidatus Sulfotelmatobacter sp.]